MRLALRGVLPRVQGAGLRSTRLAHRRLASLSLDTINPNVLEAQYAVRGEIVLRAAEIKKELAADPNSKPFSGLVECNIGNPQAVGQQPLSFNRQVLAMLTMPSLVDNPAAAAIFAPDAVERAKEYLAAIPAGVGAYSESQGFEIVRKQVAAFLTERDGIAADPKELFLTDGASKGVGFLLNLVLSDSNDGVLVPIPQYPLYSASLTLMGAQLLGYQLDEEKGWSLPIAKLKEQVHAATPPAPVTSRPRRCAPCPWRPPPFPCLPPSPASHPCCWPPGLPPALPPAHPPAHP